MVSEVKILAQQFVKRFKVQHLFTRLNRSLCYCSSRSGGGVRVISMGELDIYS